MRYLFTLLIILSSSLLMAQDVPCPPEEGCQCLLNKANAILEQPNADYERVLYLYFAAQACDESLAGEAEEQIVKLFEKIETLRVSAEQLRRTAEERALLIEQQQADLIREKEIAEEATRKAIAQNLNNLASRAIQEGNMIEAIQLMQYANTYDPDNRQWLENLQEIFIRNAPGYPTDSYLNLVPTLVFNAAPYIEGTIRLKEFFISYGQEGDLVAWDMAGNTKWNKTYDSPIAGLVAQGNQNGFISWDETGEIRVHDTIGVVKVSFNHGPTPIAVYDLRAGNGFLSWSADHLIIWDSLGNKKYSIENEPIHRLVKSQISDRYFCVFPDGKFQEIAYNGELVNGLQIPTEYPVHGPPIAFFDISDSIILMSTHRTIDSWNGTSLSPIEFTRLGIDSMVQVMNDHAFLAWTGGSGIFSMELKLGIDGDVETIQPSQDGSGFFVESHDGTLERFDWEGKTIFSIPHDASLIRLEEINENEHLLYNCENGSIYIRDNSSGELIFKMYPGQPILDFAFEPETKIVMAWASDGTIYRWAPFDISPPRFNRGKGSYFNSNMEVLADHSGLIKGTQDGFDIYDWNGEKVKKLKVGSFTSSEFHQHQGIIYLFKERTLYRFDLKGEPIDEIALEFNVLQTDFFILDSTIIGYDNGGTINILDLNGQQMTTFELGKSIQELLPIPDVENLFTTFDYGGQIDTWSIQGEHVTGPLKKPGSGISELITNEDGSIIIAIGAGKINVWNAAGDFLLEQEVEFWHGALCIHPNYNGFLYADEFGSLFFYDWEGSSEAVVHLDSRITQIDIAQDGSSLIIMTEAGNISFLDPLGNEYSSLKFHSRVDRVEYIQECQSYIAYTKEGERLNWSLVPSDILQANNYIGIPGFTEQEKLKYGIDSDIEVNWEYVPYPWRR